MLDFLRKFVRGSAPRGRIQKGMRALALVPILIIGMTFVAVRVDAQSTSSGGIQQILQSLGGSPNVSQGQQQGPVPAPTSGQVLLQPEAVRPGTLPTSRLEQIMSSRAGVNLTQFGYDQFGVGRGISVLQTGAVSDNYVIGVGDQVDVLFRGQQNSEFVATVDRNGNIVLPNLNPIQAAGRTLGDVRADVVTAAKRVFVSTQAFVSIAQLRQLNVTVAGEVNNPGMRLVTGLSSPIDAILLSGGVSKTGSLRNVKLVRGGQERTIDLYAYLTQRGHQPAILLMDGDRIVVPPLGPTVAVTGWVRRPGIYELPSGSHALTVRSLMSLAGGTEVRGRYRLSALRVQSNGASGLSSITDGEVVRDSEILFVQPGASETVQNATLSGGTPLAGSYSVGKATRLSDVLAAPGALGSNPYTLLGVIVRRDPVTRMRVLVPFTPVAVVNGRENMDLFSGDLVRVFSANESRLISAVIKAFRQRRSAADDQLHNPVNPLDMTATNVPNNPSDPNAVVTAYSDERYDLAALSAAVLTDGGVLSLPQQIQPLQLSGQNFGMNTAAAQSQLAANNAARSGNQNSGQATAGSSSPQYSPNSLDPSGASLFAGGIANNNAGNSSGNSSNSGGGIGSNNPPSNSSPQSPSENGQVPPFLPQQSIIAPQSSNFQDQSFNASAVPTNQEVMTFGQLARQLDVDGLVLIHFLMAHTASIDGSVNSAGSYLVGPNVALQDLVAAAGGANEWTDTSRAEVISSIVGPGMAHTEHKLISLDQSTLASLMVHPRDEVHLNEVFSAVGYGMVTIQGQVRSPGTYRVERGEKLSDILLRAGGVTDVAYPYGTVFLRKSAANAERQSYDRAAHEMEDAIATGVTKQGNSRLSPDALSAMQVFISDLRNTRATGRMSVIADPAALAANPQRDVLLEPGDVIFIPQRPSTIAVVGQVAQPGNIPFESDLGAKDYIERAGGITASADNSMIFVVFPDGTAHHVERSWLTLQSEDIPPGSTVVVPRDYDQIDLRQFMLDLSTVLSQVAVSAASLVVVSRNSN